MNEKNAIIQRMTRLFLKEVFEELTREERMELENWLQVDPAHREWYEQMKTLEFVKKDYQYYTEITEPIFAWKRLVHDMERKSYRHHWAWIYSAAATIVVIFSIILFLKKGEGEQQKITSSDVHATALVSLIVDNGRDSIRLEMNEDILFAKNGVRTKNNTLKYDSVVASLEEAEYHTLSVGRGGEYCLTLSDGTLVWLNSESSLRYPIRFTGERREVELRGEAFFQVSPNEKMPFEVRSGDFNVEVLGTSFNIMNYPDERYAQVTLATGKLQVSRKEQCAVILPDHQVQLTTEKFEVRQVNARYYTSWIKHKFMFDDEPLEVIIRKLARWYDLDYKFKDLSLKETRFSGQLFKYDDITKAFELLELTTDVHFSIHQKTIRIMRKK